jgi:hypothetical protein
MKIYLLKISASVFLLFLMIAWNGCDEFNKLPLNIPFTLTVHLTGSDNTISDSSDLFCLTQDSQTYQKYQDKINSLHFIEAAYRTISVVPTDLSGNITVALKDGNDNVLFQYVIPNATPADYMKPNSPYVLQLNQTQIDFINQYLSTLLNSGACFYATVTVDNINGQPPYTLDGAIDMVIEADTQL